MGVESNVTVAAQVASKLDSSLDSVSQDTLIAIYKQFPILAEGISSVTYGQMLAAVVVFVFILFLRPLLVSLIINFIKKIAAKTENRYDDRVALNLKKPLKFSFLILGLYVFISILYIQNRFVDLTLASMAMFNFFWFVWSIIDAMQGLLYKATAKVSKELSGEFTGFVLKIIKIIVWVLAFSSVLSIWGVNVTALIASLGLGGLAFALAAKDTAANLFGSIAILVDKTIKIGEWIRLEGIDGIVEDIGMRTTKIRTFDKTLIIVPNQIVANSKIENMSRRAVRRILMNIGLTYETTNEQVEAITTQIRQMLQNHKNIAQDERLLVNFTNFGDSAKEIFINVYATSTDWQEYLEIREDVHYKINEIVTKNGSSFAFPSQSIYVESLPKADTKQK